ncbi:MAG: hypothetical protein VYB54_02165 [Pseudomonadota bacterium]|nr:hypothetical protein [Pseudomonadota bacterium]
MRVALTALLLLTVATAASAQESRRFRAIASPEAVPEGQEPVAQVDPVSREAANNAVKEVLQAWNDGRLGDYLGEDFVDRGRLLDSVTEDVPRDASVRVLGLSAVQTVQQFRSTGEGGARLVTSIVSANADTQVEFNDPVRGFRTLRGQNTFFLRITEEVVE